MVPRNQLGYSLGHFVGPSFKFTVLISIILRGVKVQARHHENSVFMTVSGASRQALPPVPRQPLANRHRVTCSVSHIGVSKTHLIFIILYIYRRLDNIPILLEYR